MHTTKSLLIAAAIGASGNRVFMIGGEYRPESEQNIGALAMELTGSFVMWRMLRSI